MTLDGVQLGTLLGWVAALIVVSGILLLIFRLVLEGNAWRSDVGADKSMVRGWLAISLVAGLLLFAAASFFIADDTLRSLLMGGVVASAGTATAFYFATKASEQTQKNLLNAAFGSAEVTLPELTGMTVGQARGVLKALQLEASLKPENADNAKKVGLMAPVSGSKIKTGGTVTLTVV